MPDNNVLGLPVRTTLTTKNSSIFFGLIFGGATIVCLWLGISNYFFEKDFLSRAELDNGTIIRYQLQFSNSGKFGSQYCPDIVFTSKSGELVAVLGKSCWGGYDASMIGQPMRVYYDPQHPLDYQDEDIKNIREYGGLIFSLIGAVFCGFLTWVFLT